MKKNLLFVMAAMALVGSSHATVQWDVPLTDFDMIACWDAETCAPTEGYVHMYSPANPADEMTVPCLIQGPQGQPLVYSFIANVDDEIDCATTYVVDHCSFLAEGPGFQYNFSYEPPMFTLFYSCGPNFPVDVNITEAADGCYEEPIPYHMVAGETYTFTSDWTQDADSTLMIEGGAEIFIMEGVNLTFTGEVEAGSGLDNPVMIHGDNWGSLIFNEGANAHMTGIVVTGSASTDDGGAFHVNSGAAVSIFKSVIAGNSTTGNGGAAYIADGGFMYLYQCTVSHNSAADGGNFYLGGGFALLQGELNLVTFASPENTEIAGAGVITLGFSDVYPQADNFPGGWVSVYNCDPGYMDAENGDFSISYWSIDDPTMANCTIDVALNGEVDPDGTAADMGAFPFDQYQILHAATIVGVEDRADDQGGFVLLHFDASENDGNVINPVTQYSLWIQYPGMEEDEWVAAGTVAAIGDADMTYVAQIATLDDQYEGMENIHNFMVGTHSVWFPLAIPSNEMTGFSLDNIAPMPVAGLGDGGWYYDAWPPEYDNVDLSWAPSTDNDFDHYEVYASLTNDFAGAELVYEGTALSTTWTVEFGTLGENDPVYFWAVAIDEHMNAADASEYTVMYEDVQTALPASFELAQNHPNPFNPTTSIAYALPQAADVSLKVFNMTGAEVATLVQGAQAAGNYTVNFDASSLASGVYVYRIEAGSFTDVKKMVLVK